MIVVIVASSSRERRAHRVDPGRGRPRGHLARGRRHGGKASRAATRRGGGPEASSATATIVAVTMSDARPRRAAAEHWHGAPPRPSAAGRRAGHAARRADAASRARDGADRARVVAEDDARPPQRRQDQGAASRLAREARGHPRDAPRGLVVGPPVWKSFGRPIDTMPNPFDFHTEVNPPRPARRRRRVAPAQLRVDIVASAAPPGAQPRQLRAGRGPRRPGPESFDNGHGWFSKRGVGGAGGAGSRSWPRPAAGRARRTARVSSSTVAAAAARAAARRPRPRAGAS